MFVWAFPTRLVKFQFTIHPKNKSVGKIRSVPGHLLPFTRSRVHFIIIRRCLPQISCHTFKFCVFIVDRTDFELHVYLFSMLVYCLIVWSFTIATSKQEQKINEISHFPFTIYHSLLRTTVQTLLLQQPYTMAIKMSFYCCHFCCEQHTINKSTN